MIKYSLILPFLALIACSENKKLPPEVLNKEQMVEIIVAVEINQAIYKLKFAQNDSIDYNQLITHMFEQLNTTQEQLNTSLAYYAEHPKTMEGIYNQAIIQLTQKQAKTQARKAN